MIINQKIGNYYQEIVDSYRTGKISLPDFIAEFIDEPLDWGSCQYDTARGMFEMMNLLQKNGYNPFEVLKIDDDHSRRPTVTAANIANVVERFAADVTEHIEDCYPGEMDKEIREERLAAIKAIEKAGLESVTLNSVFESAKNNSWDLWTISLTVCEWLYGKEYEEYLKKSIGKSPGSGPIFNVLAQSQNYVVGAICYCLYVDGLVTDPYNTYYGFDT